MTNPTFIRSFRLLDTAKSEQRSIRRKLLSTDNNKAVIGLTLRHDSLQRRIELLTRKMRQ